MSGTVDRGLEADGHRIDVSTWGIMTSAYMNALKEGNPDIIALDERYAKALFENVSNHAARLSLARTSRGVVSDAERNNELLSHLRIKGVAHEIIHDIRSLNGAAQRWYEAAPKADLDEKLTRIREILGAARQKAFEAVDEALAIIQQAKTQYCQSSPDGLPAGQVMIAADQFTALETALAARLPESLQTLDGLEWEINGLAVVAEAFIHRLRARATRGADHRSFSDADERTETAAPQPTEADKAKAPDMEARRTETTGQVIFFPASKDYKDRRS